MLEEILSAENLKLAERRVRGNKGAPGVDGMTVHELGHFLNTKGENLTRSILEGSYRPKPVRKVEIPKPNGGKRMLGIPTVIDRAIQQAISQVLSRKYESEFSTNSYGYRVGRRASQAVAEAKSNGGAGYRWTVEIDLEKFFDQVNHDHLMSLLSRRIADKRVLKLIRGFLTSGIMCEGVIIERETGTPQGSPLSPLLSNVVLNELDKELEKRGHRFVRYADDCTIYVKSERAGERVKASVSRYIETKLKLTVNQSKTKVSPINKSRLLGFSFYFRKGAIRVRLAEDVKERFKDKLRSATKRWESISIAVRLKRLKQIVVGWVNYFKIADCGKWLAELDGWVRRRIRCCIWVTWKKTRTRIANLKRLGISKENLFRYGLTRKGHWRAAGSPIMEHAITNARMLEMGYTSLVGVYRPKG